MLGSGRRQVAGRGPSGPMLDQMEAELPVTAARGLVAPAIRRSTRWPSFVPLDAHVRPPGAGAPLLGAPIWRVCWPGRRLQAVVAREALPRALSTRAFATHIPVVLTGPPQAAPPSSPVPGGPAPVALDGAAAAGKHLGNSELQPPKNFSSTILAARSSCWAKPAAPRAPAPRRHEPGVYLLGSLSVSAPARRVALVGALGQRMVDQDALHRQRHHPRKTAAACYRARLCSSAMTVASCASPVALSGPVSRATSARRRSGATVIGSVRESLARPTG